MPGIRLQPPITREDALAWLRAQAILAWGSERLPQLEDGLKLTAEAMAAVSAADLPADLEPLFP